MKKSLNQIRDHLVSMPQEKKMVVLYIGVAIFFLFFSYPFMRSTITSLFIESYGAAKSPYVWLCSILSLSMSVTIYNRIFHFFRPHQVFIGTGVLSVLLFLLGTLGLYLQGSLWLYFLYVLKETYIILLVHSAFAFINITLEEETAKVIYGPLGAIGSIGGLLGGAVVAMLSGHLSEVLILLLGTIFIFLSSASFYKTRNLIVDKVRELIVDNDNKKLSPLKSLTGVRSYVLCIALLVILSQFVVSITNYKFNFFLESNFALVDEKTAFLGKVYSYTNALSLLIQFFVMPLLFKTFSPVFVHFVVPVLMGSLFFTLGQWGAMGAAFIMVKGLDYSIFSGAKELLYFSLSDIQKYGAKYVVDMIAYRLSKGLISLILILIPTSGIVVWLFTASLIMWILTLCVLKNIYDKLHGEYHEQPNT
jgi:AAA family ATP:ADP antiporter